MSLVPGKRKGKLAQLAIPEITWCKVAIPGTKAQPPDLKGASVSTPRAARPRLRCREKKEHIKRFRGFHLKAKFRIWP